MPRCLKRLQRTKAGSEFKAPACEKIDSFRETFLSAALNLKSPPSPSLLVSPSLYFDSYLLSGVVR